MEGFVYFALLLLAMVVGYIVGLSSTGPMALKTFTNSLYRLLPAFFTVREKKHSPYLAGLAQVINNEPDAAVESFTDSFEVNTQTLDTHIAIGDLLRRRGEVDKATYVHQNILKSGLLNSEQMQLARMALALDYQQAGLLDRAEALFKELVSSPVRRVRQSSIRSLAGIYEQEQEWLQAIEMLVQLRKITDEPEQKALANLQAHYCCELADSYIGTLSVSAPELAVPSLANPESSKQSLSEAQYWVAKAIAFSGEHARARLLAAQLDVKFGQWERALSWLLPLNQFAQDVDVVGTVAPLLRQIYQKLGKEYQFDKELKSLYQSQPSPTLVPLMAEILAREELEAVSGAKHAGNPGFAAGYESRPANESQAAIQFLCSELEKIPSLRPFAHIVLLQNNGIYSLQTLIDAVTSATSDSVTCQSCGFESQLYYWRCPTCKAWH